MNVRLYFWQRATAAVLAPLMIGHLLLILYAARNGMAAADILARTRGSVLWLLYYGVFVLAAAVHAAIGMRGVCREWGPSRLAASDRMLDVMMWVMGLVLTGLGWRAVYGVIA